MTTLDKWLKALAERPDIFAPFSDWCEEHGHEEFVKAILMAEQDARRHAQLALPHADETPQMEALNSWPYLVALCPCQTGVQLWTNADDLMRRTLKYYQLMPETLKGCCSVQTPPKGCRLYARLEVIVSLFYFRGACLECNKVRRVDLPSPVPIRYHPIVSANPREPLA